MPRRTYDEFDRPRPREGLPPSWGRVMGATAAWERLEGVLRAAQGRRGGWGAAPPRGALATAEGVLP